MKKTVISLIRQFAFWLLFFDFARLFFLVFYSHHFIVEKVPFTEIILLFWHAIRLDISTACYVLVLPFLLLFLHLFIGRNFLNTLIKIYSFLIIVLFGLITTAEIGIYAEWKTKLDYKALYYLNHPKEIADTASTGSFFILLLIFVLQSGIAIWAFHKYFYLKPEAGKDSILLRVSFILLAPFMFLGIRGGIQSIPINQSESYFSRHNIVNLVAVNSGYNLYYSYMENKDFMKENPFNFFPIDEARKTTEFLHRPAANDHEEILKVEKPNIVFLLLESFSGDLIESLGGEPGITPNFHELEKDGILFTHLYASGNRSQQAMSAIFGGFPSIPVTAITHNPNKFIKLPSLTKELKKAGYNSSYMFGGQLIYGGLRAYIMFNEFDRIIEDKDFDPSIPRGKLGVHDQYTLERLLGDLNKAKSPFFSVLFTLSSHSPYDQPKDNNYNWNGGEADFVTSAHYTDRCLGDFFAKARKQPWFANTLFVIVADHSHNTYRNWGVNTPPYRKIPLLFYGEALKDEVKGRKISRVSSQTDIATTILNQLHLSSKPFIWSRDLFNPTYPEFAYYEINVGCGWITPKGHFIYQKTTGKLEECEFSDHSDSLSVKQGKSYLQTLFQQFMEF